MLSISQLFKAVPPEEELPDIDPDLESQAYLSVDAQQLEHRYRTHFKEVPGVQILRTAALAPRSGPRCEKDAGQMLAAHHTHGGNGEECHGVQHLRDNLIPRVDPVCLFAYMPISGQ